MVEVLIQKIKENCTNVDLNVVNKAFNFAFEAHKEQKRESGEPEQLLCHFLPLRIVEADACVTDYFSSFVSFHLNAGDD